MYHGEVFVTKIFCMLNTFESTITKNDAIPIWIRFHCCWPQASEASLRGCFIAWKAFGAKGWMHSNTTSTQVWLFLSQAPQSRWTQKYAGSLMVQSALAQTTIMCNVLELVIVSSYFFLKANYCPSFGSVDYC